MDMEKIQTIKRKKLKNWNCKKTKSFVSPARTNLTWNLKDPGLQFVNSNKKIYTDNSDRISDF